MKKWSKRTVHIFVGNSLFKKLLFISKTLDLILQRNAWHDAKEDDGRYSKMRKADNGMSNNEV